MTPPDTSSTGSTQTPRRSDTDLAGGAYIADTGSSTPHPNGLVSPEVRSDAEGPLRGTGLDADVEQGLEQASRDAQAALGEAAQRALQRGSELAAAARARVQRLKEMDEQRDSFPGEHWLTLGAGLFLMTRRSSSFLGQVLTVAAGAALVYRSMTGRDSLVPTLQAQASRLSNAVSAARPDNWTMPEDEQRQERSSQLPM